VNFDRKVFTTDMGSLSILRSENRAGYDQMLLMPDGAMQTVHQAAPPTSAVDLVVSQLSGPLIKPAGFNMPGSGWFDHVNIMWCRIW